MDTNPLVLDPEPIPNIVLHPGDTLTVEDTPPDDAVLYLHDRRGITYAVLDCDYNRRDEYTIRSIRYVADRPGRELLPLRPDPDDQSHLDPLPLGQPVPDTASPTATLSANYGPPSHPHSITHGHVHSHPTSPLAQPTFYDHAHRHTHYGDYAHRANAFGHTNDGHGDHAH